MLCDVSDVITDTYSSTKIHIVKISSKVETAGVVQFSDVSGKNHVPIDSAAAKITHSMKIKPAARALSVVLPGLEVTVAMTIGTIVVKHPARPSCRGAYLEPP